MAASVREFLETYPLHERLEHAAAAWRHGEWPDEVNALCRVCGGRRAHRMWPSQVAGVTPGWGVYMLSGTCETCRMGRVFFWIEVNPREGWIQKAGQLPPPPLGRIHVSVAAN